MCPQSKTINQGLNSDPMGDWLGSSRPSPRLVSYQHCARVLEALFGLIFKYNCDPYQASSQQAVCSGLTAYGWMGERNSSNLSSSSSIRTPPSSEQYAMACRLVISRWLMLFSEIGGGINGGAVVVVGSPKKAAISSISSELSGEMERGSSSSSSQSSVAAKSKMAATGTLLGDTVFLHIRHNVLSVMVVRSFDNPPHTKHMQSKRDFGSVPRRRFDPPMSRTEK